MSHPRQHPLLHPHLHPSAHAVRNGALFVIAAALLLLLLYMLLLPGEAGAASVVGMLHGARALQVVASGAL